MLKPYAKIPTMIDRATFSITIACMAIKQPINKLTDPATIP